MGIAPGHSRSDMLNPEHKVDTLREWDMSAIGGRKKLSLSSSLLGLSLLVLLAAKPADSPVADAAEQGDTQIVRTLLQLSLIHI